VISRYSRIFLRSVASLPSPCIYIIAHFVLFVKGFLKSFSKNFALSRAVNCFAEAYPRPLDSYIISYNDIKVNSQNAQTFVPDSGHNAQMVESGKSLEKNGKTGNNWKTGRNNQKRPVKALWCPFLLYHIFDYLSRPFCKIIAILLKFLNILHKRKRIILFPLKMIRRHICAIYFSCIF
jgi:hypothetical protein